MCACEPIESDSPSDFGRLILFYDAETRRKEETMHYVNYLRTITLKHLADLAEVDKVLEAYNRENKEALHRAKQIKADQLIGY